MKAASPPSANPRLSWLDITKGISILWIALFHFFIAYDNGRHPWPLKLFAFPSFVAECASSSSWGATGCILDGIVTAILQRGAQPVGVFLVLSGFGLTYSLARTGYPTGGWGRWYRKRLLRLFPMYWVAHLIYLVSPFVHRQDAIDYRFLLSFIGDRVYPAETMFYYFNPALWFFGLLIELYIVFPLLFLMLQKLGPMRHLMVCALITVVSRYVLSGVLQANGNYVQGAFFGARLWEFAAGMVLAFYYRKHPASVEEHLFSWKTFLAGLVVYTAGVYSYEPNFAYTLSDALTGIGLFIILAHVARWSDAIPVLRSTLLNVGTYSHGLYLLHQPYVIYFGERLRPQNMATFVFAACIIIGILVLACIPLERLTNRITRRFFEGERIFPSAASPSAQKDKRPAGPH